MTGTDLEMIKRPVKVTNRNSLRKMSIDILEQFSIEFWKEFRVYIDFALLQFVIA